MRAKSSKAKPREGNSGTTAAEALAWLQANGTRRNIQELQRYGIVAPKALGVTVGEIKKYAQQIGTDHDLALALWDSGWYEARLLAAFVDDARQVTVRQMNAWAATFDNWAVVDTVCFSLFDRAPDRWKMIPVWARAKPEFKKRAAFALLWSLSRHDKSAPDTAFIACLPLIEQGAQDSRHFVKKAVDMALRAVGTRSPVLHQACMESAQRLSQSHEEAPRWVGSHALRELAKRSR